MNWLAHLRLAPDDPLLRIGNLCGDFVRGVDLASLHPVLQQGVQQHRAIDRFVDAHEVVRRSRARLDPPFRRYTGVLVDVFYDHFLARSWQRLGPGGSLEAFAAATHASLREHHDLLPPRLQQAVHWMQSERWLVGYAELAGIDAVLRRMAGRLSRENPLADGGEQLQRHFAGLETDFEVLWPELAAFVIVS